MFHVGCRVYGVCGRAVQDEQSTCRIQGGGGMEQNLPEMEEGHAGSQLSNEAHAVVVFDRRLPRLDVLA